MVADLQQSLQNTTRDVVRVGEKKGKSVDVDGSVVVAAQSIWSGNWITR